MANTNLNIITDREIKDEQSRGLMRADIIEEIINSILHGNIENGRTIIESRYPFRYYEIEKRRYSKKQKMEQFKRDGFIDRYTGDRLLHPGILKIISTFYSEEFPYQAHWKMSETHIAYWECNPTIDHIIPIARGGQDNPSNWTTTSMLHNSIKSNWTLEQLNWELHSPGDLAEWDGLTSKYISIVEAYPELLDDNYKEEWYKVSK